MSEEKPADVDKLAGEIAITVHKARGLKNTEFFGKADPFCTIRLDEEEYRTRIHENAGSRPVWEQTFKMEVMRRGKQRLVCLIRDSDHFDSKFMARLEIPLTDLVKKYGNNPCKWFVVQQGGKDAGEILLSCVFDGDGLPGDREQKEAPKAVAAPPLQRPAATPQAQPLLVAPGSFTPAPRVPYPPQAYPPAQPFVYPPAAQGPPRGYPHQHHAYPFMAPQYPAPYQAGRGVRRP